jgi:hypothetical protein
MKNRSIYLVLVIFLIANLVACAAPTTPTLAPSDTPAEPPTSTPPIPTPTAGFFGERIESGRITSAALAGNLLSDPATRTYWVYLPPGYYETDKRYPVVYVLHWFTGGGTTFVRPSRDALESLIKKGEVKDMILVFPDANNIFGGSIYMSSPTIGDYETYIANELVNKIDSTYRTIPNRDSRGIMGCSMGGEGAIHLAFKYPDIFGVAAPMSGFLNNPDFVANWEFSQSKFKKEIKNWVDFYSQDMSVQFLMALTAVASPDPSKPPFYLDMPFNFVNGKAEINQEVYLKMESLTLENDIQRYLAQPVRLNNVLIYGDTGLEGSASDQELTIKILKYTDQLFTENGVEHEFGMVENTHCGFDFSPIFKFMDKNLVFEQTE